MKKHHFFPVLASLVLSISSYAQTQTINWDIQHLSTYPLSSGNDGALSVGGSYWNNSANTVNALDESGVATSVDIVLRQWMGSITRSVSHALFDDDLTAGWSSPLLYNLTRLDSYSLDSCKKSNHKPK